MKSGFILSLAMSMAAAQPVIAQSESTAPPATSTSSSPAQKAHDNFLKPL